MWIWRAWEDKKLTQTETPWIGGRVSFWNMAWYLNIQLWVLKQKQYWYDTTRTLNNNCCASSRKNTNNPVRLQFKGVQRREPQTPRRSSSLTSLNERNLISTLVRGNRVLKRSTWKKPVLVRNNPNTKQCKKQLLCIVEQKYNPVWPLNRDQRRESCRFPLHHDPRSNLWWVHKEIKD